MEVLTHFLAVLGGFGFATMFLRRGTSDSELRDELVKCLHEFTFLRARNDLNQVRKSNANARYHSIRNLLGMEE